MGLFLSSDDMRRVGAAAEALLSPLARPDPDAWWRESERRVRDLFPGANVMFSVPTTGRIRNASESIDETALARIDQFGETDDRGQFLIKEEAVGWWTRYRRERAIEVWNERMNLHVLERAGFRVASSAFYHEGLLGARLFEFSGLSSVAPHGGEIFLTLGYDRRGLARFGAEDDMSVLGMLLPAFRAGHLALGAFGARQAGLASMLDGVSEALVVIGADGRELHRNRAFRAMLEREPDRERVEHAVRLAGSELMALRSGRLLRSGGPAAEQRVATAAGRYAARATFASEEVWGAAGAILVAVERDASASAGAQPTMLVSRFGLTEREAQAASLLARRVSNAELAAALGVSPHTARHHTEKVMQKLGVHSRKELATVMHRESGMGNGE